jgi:hypothetical protein
MRRQPTGGVTYMSRTGLAALAATLSCALLLGLASSAGAQTSPTTDLTKRIPITGVSKNGKKFKGTFTINRFASRGGKVFAVGVLKGKLKHRNVTRRGVRIPVSNFAKQGGAMSAQVACPILTLTLGPLDLNLLGLRVQLNRINLRITAIPGGGLLGDLLCGLSGLLNPTGLTGGNLAAVLNSLLALVPTNPTAAGAAAG